MSAKCSICESTTGQQCNDIGCGYLESGNGEPEYVLYGYATPSGKLYASGMDAVQAGEQSWVKVYVNKEDLK